MAITKPPVLPAWAESGDKVTPTNAEIQTGWPLSSTPPSRQRFNWILNFCANAVRYFSRRGIVDYDAAETYMTGDRVLGADGVTYKALADNVTAITPGTDTSKWQPWGNQGNFAGIASITATGAIAANHIGKGINVACVSTGQTISLPAANAVQPGASMVIYNNGQPYTLSRAGSDTLSADGSAKTTLSIPTGGMVVVISNGSNQWAVVGPGVISQQGDMAASTAANGYQKLPSGLLVQWGSANATTGGTAVTFPIAFPNACRVVVPGVTNGPAIYGVSSSVTPTTTGTTLYSSTGSVSASYIAIGY